MKRLYIEKIEELEKALKYGYVEPHNLENNGRAIMVFNIDDDNHMSISFDASKVYYRVPEIAGERMLFGVIQLISILGNYIPVYDMNNNLLFTKEQFELIRNKMQGLSHYGSNEYSFSNNLDFDGIETYLDEIDDSFADSNNKRNAVIKLLKEGLMKQNITLGYGKDANADVVLIDIGSTGRGTNIPNDADFDFIARINPTIYNDPNRIADLKATMIKILGGSLEHNLLHGQARNVSCFIPEIRSNLKVDITYTSSEKKMEYTTEMALIDRLETMKKTDLENYKKVIANIIFAKKYLKQYGVYKPSRSDREQAGLGGVGLENLIFQNGGSFYDAAKEFLSYAEGKNFIEFEKAYPIFDFGKNHVSVEKNQFPYDNFVMRNMRRDGYDKMCACLKKYVDEYEMEMNNDERREK